MAEPSLESIFSPEIIENPYPMYQALREGSPVLELPEANMLVLKPLSIISAPPYARLYATAPGRTRS